jgi:hypothetical protein
MPYKRVLKYVAFALVLLFQVYLFFFKSFEVLDFSTYVNQHPLPLFGEIKDISQEFRSPGPLTRIDIMLANYLKKPEGGTLRLSIFRDEERVFFRNYPANNAEDNRFYSFNIARDKTPPISMGNYRLQLKYFPKNPVDKLAAWIHKKGIYPYGKLFVNNKPHKGDLTFRVYFHSTIWNAKNYWLKSQPQPFIRPYLLLGSLSLLLLALNYLFYYILSLLFSASDGRVARAIHRRK